MNRVSADDGFRVCLGEADEAHLPGVHELGHGADRFLDRYLAVRPMLIVEIDVVRLEALQRGVATGPYVVCTALDAVPAAVFAARDAELGRQGDLVAPSLERLRQQDFIREWAIHVRPIPERAPDLCCPIEDAKILSL